MLNNLPLFRKYIAKLIKINAGGFALGKLEPEQRRIANTSIAFLMKGPDSVVTHIETWVQPNHIQDISWSAADTTQEEMMTLHLWSRGNVYAANLRFTVVTTDTNNDRDVKSVNFTIPLKFDFLNINSIAPSTTTPSNTQLL